MIVSSRSIRYGGHVVVDRPIWGHVYLQFPVFLLLLVALGVLLLCPRELDVESGISSDGSSHPWHDFFEFESEKKVSSA